jgi:hypothetical protein
VSSRTESSCSQSLTCSKGGDLPASWTGRCSQGLWELPFIQRILNATTAGESWKPHRDFIGGTSIDTPEPPKASRLWLRRPSTTNLLSRKWTSFSGEPGRIWSTDDHTKEEHGTKTNQSSIAYRVSFPDPDNVNGSGDI